ncbi:hypothetical protein [Actinomadura rubrisoli]|uniref:Uncharacterized protein n=1 Tax=Actinomadura rubrisoli TaxID=2530368 RepID=A0A4R5CDL1_9ACTN|nr:hypothetical protein [Actinomadura rubrisoli]TDD97605.1 hypothetical protein E1298_00820 [Actinomadura rubrisoli]
MSIRAIKIGCDTPACWAFCKIDQPTADKAREYAAERWGWTRRDGLDICDPCSRGNTPQARGES